MTQDKIIYIKDLYTSENGEDHFEYSKFAEQCVLDLIADYKGWTRQEIKKDSGFQPLFDAVLNEHPVEIKISKTNLLNVEFSRPDFYPSGITRSAAEYYIMVNSGFNKQLMTTTGKVRMLPRLKLLQYTIQAVFDGKTKIYDASANSPGAIVALIDPKTLKNDGWLFDVKAVLENGSVIGYDFSSIIRYHKNDKQTSLEVKFL